MASVFKSRNLDPKKRKKGRPAVLFNVKDVPRESWSAGDRFAGVVRPLGLYGGRVRVGVHMEVIPPGKWNSTFHWHTDEEEHFFFLEGRGVARIGNRTMKVKAGDYVVFPPNTKLAHSFQGQGKKGLRYLVIGTREKGDVCFYPDSGKVAIRGPRMVGRFTRTDYWEGEV